MLPKLLKSLSSWPTTLTVSLLILVGATAVKLWPRTVPFSQCSEVYQKYAGNPDIDASFIKDFRINDTLAVDVTVLKAKDTNGWGVMTKDFDFPNLSPELLQDIYNGEDLVFTKSFPKINVPTPDSFDKDLLAISYLNHTITVFHVMRKDETTPILFYSYRDIIKP